MKGDVLCCVNVPYVDLGDMASKQITIDHSKPNSSLEEAGISQKQLSEVGLDRKQIRRLYQVLYVYSVGVHDALLNVLNQSRRSAHMIAPVWRSYLMLLSNVHPEVFQRGLDDCKHALPLNIFL